MIITIRYVGTAKTQGQGVYLAAVLENLELKHGEKGVELVIEYSRDDEGQSILRLGSASGWNTVLFRDRHAMGELKVPIRAVTLYPPDTRFGHSASGFLLPPSVSREFLLSPDPQEVNGDPCPTEDSGCETMAVQLQSNVGVAPNVQWRPARREAVGTQFEKLQLRWRFGPDQDGFPSTISFSEWFPTSPNSPRDEVPALVGTVELKLQSVRRTEGKLNARIDIPKQAYFSAQRGREAVGIDPKEAAGPMVWKAYSRETQKWRARESREAAAWGNVGVGIVVAGILVLVAIAGVIRWNRAKK